MTDEESRPQLMRYRTGRTVGFSDGVFSIAITLLVFGIEVPSGSENDLLRALIAEWPSYMAYLVSFATIGAVWFSHTVITEYLDHANSTFIRLNLLVLLAVSFLPFPTRLVADYIGEVNAERVAVTVLGINLLLTLILVSVVWRYAVQAQLVRPDLADEDVRTLTKRAHTHVGRLRGDDHCGTVPASSCRPRLPGARLDHPHTVQRTPAPAESRLTYTRSRLPP